jgi:hypothetical protein
LVEICSPRIALIWVIALGLSACCDDDERPAMVFHAGWSLAEGIDSSRYQLSCSLIIPTILSPADEICGARKRSAQPEEIYCDGMLPGFGKGFVAAGLAVVRTPSGVIPFPSWRAVKYVTSRSDGLPDDDWYFGVTETSTGSEEPCPCDGGPLDEVEICYGGEFYGGRVLVDRRGPPCPYEE